MYSVVIPPLIKAGGGSIRLLPEILNKLQCQRPIIITDNTMVSLGYVQRLQDVLSEANVSASVFSDTVPEPTSDSITAAVDTILCGNFDGLIALGGGSPIDSAKAIAMLASYGGEMRDYKFPRQVEETALPVVAIPTTAGTGSEATRFTIITDSASNEKMLCAGQGFLPSAAIIDFELTLSLPNRITADTGIDALTHAIEAYVSRKANPYSSSQALAAMRLIGQNLQTAYHQGQDRNAREAMMLGSFLAGVAFSNASVALVHGMSRPIGALFHMPHGLSNAMLLPAITQWSAPAAQAQYADCARAIGIVSSLEGEHIAVTKLIDFLEALNQELNVPTLSQFGIDKATYFDSLTLMAKQAISSGSPSNNPRVASVDEMIELYRQVWR
jgi:alcohol dehydrogenase class IV